MKTTETKKQITVKKDIENPEPTELIAKSIIQLSDAIEKFQKGPLKERTILVLLNDMTNVPMGTIQKILKAIPSLKKDYLK